MTKTDTATVEALASADCGGRGMSAFGAGLVCIGRVLAKFHEKRVLARKRELAAIRAQLRNR